MKVLPVGSGTSGCDRKSRKRLRKRQSKYAKTDQIRGLSAQFMIDCD
jgi:hypothetical protein